MKKKLTESIVSLLAFVTVILKVRINAKRKYKKKREMIKIFIYSIVFLLDAVLKCFCCNHFLFLSDDRNKRIIENNF